MALRTLGANSLLSAVAGFVDGDTIAGAGYNLTIDVDCTIGGVSATATDNTLDMSGGSGTGALTINAGVTVQFYGRILIDDAALTVGAGATIRAMNGTGSPRYSIIYGTTTNRANTRLVVNGTSGAHVTFTKESGAGNPFYGRAANNGSYRSGLELTYCDVLDWGVSSVGFGNEAFEANGNAATHHYTQDHVTYTRCGRRTLLALNAGANFDLSYIDAEGSLPAATTSASAWNLVLSAPSGGATRRIRGFAERDNCLNLSGVHTGLTIDGVCALRLLESSMGAGAATSLRNFWFAAHGAAGGGSSVGSLIGVPGDTVENVVHVQSSTNPQQAMNAFLSNGVASGTITNRKWIFQTFLNGSGGVVAEELDCIGIPDTNSNAPPSGQWLHDYAQILVLPNGRGNESGGLCSYHANKYHRVKFTSCTAVAGDRSGGGNCYHSANFGATWPMIGGFVQDARGNFFFRPATGAAAYTHGVRRFHGTRFSGTFTTGSSTTSCNLATIVDSEGTTRTFNTATAATLADAGAQLVITSNPGGGPAVNEAKAISTHGANSGTPVVVASAFTAAPVNTGTWRIVVPDVAASDKLDYNAWLNCRDGSVYDELGNNATTKHGYDGWELSNRSLVGANDVRIADSTALADVFHAPTRDLWGAYEYLVSKSLAPAAGGAWGSGVGYVVGDIVTDAQATVFGGRTGYWRCKAAHTSGASSRPVTGTAATWTANWEPAINYRVQKDLAAGTTYSFSDTNLSVVALNPIEAISEYVRSGWAPIIADLDPATNPSFTGAVHTTRGAVPFYTPAADGGDSSALPFGRSMRRHHARRLLGRAA